MYEQQMRGQNMNGQNMQGGYQNGQGANGYNGNANNSRPRYSAGFGTKHRCAVCGRTELDGDNMTFRYCSKCEGDLEYCQDHLYTHVHVTKNNGQ